LWTTISPDSIREGSKTQNNERPFGLGQAPGARRGNALQFFEHSCASAVVVVALVDNYIAKKYPRKTVSVSAWI
jgi:hypothetical protein